MGSLTLYVVVDRRGTPQLHTVSPVEATVIREAQELNHTESRMAEMPFGVAKLQAVEILFKLEHLETPPSDAKEDE